MPLIVKVFHRNSYSNMFLKSTSLQIIESLEKKPLGASLSTTRSFSFVVSFYGVTSPSSQ